MKKITLFLYFTLFLLSYACKKNDTTVPVITIQGKNPHVVIWGSATDYIDPGAVATDDMDGSLTVMGKSKKHSGQTREPPNDTFDSS